MIDSRSDTESSMQDNIYERLFGYLFGTEVGDNLEPRPFLRFGRKVVVEAKRSARIPSTSVLESTAQAQNAPECPEKRKSQ